MSISVKAEYRFPASLKERMIGVLLDEGVEGFVEGTDELVADIEADGGVLTCYFADSAEQLRVQRALEQSLADSGANVPLEAKVSPIRDEQWQTAWQEYWDPTQVSPTLTVAPSWVEVLPDPTDKVIRIDPQMAFGTGTHETTRLCLSWLEELVPVLKPDSLLDVGCGSGVLAIGASMFGVPRVVGTDISPEAVAASRSNAALNSVAGAEFSLKALGELHETFDIVAANILSSVLLELWNSIRACVKPGGKLLLSGLLAEEVPGFCQSVSIEPAETRQIGEWAAVLVG